MTSTPIGLGKRRRLLDLREPSPSVSMLEETLSASESEGEDSDEDIFMSRPSGIEEMSG